MSTVHINIWMLAQLQNKIQKALTIFDNPIVYTLTVMFIGMYASVIAPQGSSTLKKIFANVYFKLFFFFVIIIIAHQEPRIALILSLAFVFTMQGITEWTTKNQLKSSVFPVMKPAVASDIHVKSDNDSAPNAQPQFDDITAEDGTIYSVTGETEVGMPLHPDFVHSGPQSLGDPIAGFEDPDSLNASPF